MAPWNRGAYTRLGIKLFGAGATRVPHEAGGGVGWALLRLKPDVKETGAMKTDDPFAEAIRMAHQAMADGAEGVDLFRYADATAFAGSRPQQEGQTLAEHHRKIEMLATALRADNIPVVVQQVN